MTGPESHGAPDGTPRQSPARWAEIRGAVEAALALPESERGEFLDAACGGDALLRAQADALLRACERTAGPDSAFLAEPASAFAAPILRDGAPAPDGPGDASPPAGPPAHALDAAVLDALRAALAGSYEVERILGRGGTAAVYLARDVRHARPVAIKVLDPALGAALSAERFLREIRVTAGLTHPHILPLHDSGEADGLLYFVTPHVEGETLRDRLARAGRLGIEDALRLLREVADALAYAHGRGVVHRDIKPANILLQGEHAVVADFGIARAVGQAREIPEADPSGTATPLPHDELLSVLTAVGVSPGTPAYMAPEQVDGRAIDERTDLYALGVVAYEMLAGTHPFGARGTDALLAAHRDEPPAALDVLVPDVPPALAALVMQLLAKQPADRPASAEVVLHALAHVRAGGPPRFASRAILPVTLVVLLVILVGGYVAASRTWGSGGGGAVTADGVAADPQSLAVLPFTNVGGDPDDEYFSDGLTDELAYALGRLPGLRLAGRTSSYAFKGKDLTAPEIGRALGVGTLVSGTVRRAGARVRVTAQLVGTADGAVVWDSIFVSGISDVFALQDEIVRSIVAALVPTLQAKGDVVASAERGTSDPQAWEFYLKGRYHFLLRGTDNVRRSIDYYQRAIRRDASFARAHAGLTMAYRLLPVYLPVPMDSITALMAESAGRAVALDSTLADAQLAMAVTLGLQLRLQDQLARHRRAIALDPSSATAYLDYGFSLMNFGRNDEAIDAINRSLQLDPLVKSAASAVTLAYLGARRYPEALAAARHALALDSMFPLAYHAMGLAHEFAGQPDSAVRILERGVSLHPGDARLLAYLVYAYAAASRWDDAERIRRQLHSPETQLIDGTEAARADLVFGDPEPLIHVLTSPEGLRRYLLGGGFLGCNPLHDPLWSDARFRAAMRSLDVPICEYARPWPLPRPPASSPESAEPADRPKQGA